MVNGPADSNVVVDSYDANALLVIVCSALAVYNALELLLLIFTTFSVYRGLYFWSLLVATFAILPYTIGLCIFYFEWMAKLVGYIVNNVGWWFMVTGQSVVLYSRLGIVLGQGYDHILTFVKWMIIVDGLVLHSLGTIVTFGRYYASNAAAFNEGYRYVEKIQMTAFCLQEFIISGIYVWKTLDILKTSARSNARRVMWQLMTINVVIIIIDIALLTLEYRNLFIAEVSFKELAYSIKLKLEFAILGKLVGITHGDNRAGSTFFQHIVRTNTARSYAGDQSSVLSPMPTIMVRPLPTYEAGQKTGGDIEIHDDAQIVGTPSDCKSDPQIAAARRSDRGQADMQSADAMYADAVRIVSV